MKNTNFMCLFILIIGFTTASTASARCKDITRGELKTAVLTAVTETSAFGFSFPMWVTMVDETGKVCHVVLSDGTNIIKGKFSGNSGWLGSRVISAQKANTANAFSLDAFAISTGALSVAVYEQASLFGLADSNPVHPGKAYSGDPNNWATNKDPMIGKRVGGLNLFGGGVAIYNSSNVKIGAIGASGDTSCRDHAVAYRVRIALSLNNNPNDDGLKLVDPPANLFEQPSCGVADPSTNADDDSANDFGIRP